MPSDDVARKPTMTILVTDIGWLAWRLKAASWLWRNPIWRSGGQLSCENVLMAIIQ